jgi:hypothetical protein
MASDLAEKRPLLVQCVQPTRLATVLAIHFGFSAVVALAVPLYGLAAVAFCF